MRRNPAAQRNALENPLEIRQFNPSETFEERRKRWDEEAVIEYENLGILRSLSLLLFSKKVKIGQEILIKGGEPLDLYLFFCEKKHHVVKDYVHGRHRLECPKCAQERRSILAPNLRPAA